MRPHTTLRTHRLILRRWQDGDREPFAALNADPEVMEHFPAPMSRVESDAMIDRMTAHFDQRGFGLWALGVATTGEFIGFVGLPEIVSFARRRQSPLAGSDGPRRHDSGCGR